VLKVMTWNVENLFRPGTEFGPKSQATFDAKLQGLASMINGQAPDAVGLQEIGERDILDDLLPLLQGSGIIESPTVRMSEASAWRGCLDARSPVRGESWTFQPPPGRCSKTTVAAR